MAADAAVTTVFGAALGGEPGTGILILPPPLTGVGKGCYEGA